MNSQFFLQSKAGCNINGIIKIKSTLLISQRGNSLAIVAQKQYKVQKTILNQKRKKKR